MSNTKEVFDLLTGEITQQTTSKPSKMQNITINDALSESAKHLVVEYGSDKEYREKGKVQIERFSNITSLDVYWLMFFQNIPKFLGGDYSKDICQAYLNTRDSVNAHHKKLGVEYQESISGAKEGKEKKDKRNWVQRNITQRGKEDEQ